MGGGYLYLKVNRTLRLEGTITANAGAAACRAGTGAGGGILIDARRLVVRPGASLSAKGGDQSGMWSSYGSGAGGIIAVWTGRPYAGSDSDLRLAQEQAIPAGLSVDIGAGYDTNPGEPGSAKFFSLDSGLLLLVR